MINSQEPLTLHEYKRHIEGTWEDKNDDFQTTLNAVIKQFGWTFIDDVIEVVEMSEKKKRKYVRAVAKRIKSVVQ